MKLVIMAKCAEKDENNNKDEGSCSKESEDATSAPGEGNQPRRWKNVNNVQWRIVLISCMSMTFFAWCIFCTQAQVREGTYFIAFISGKFFSVKTLPSSHGPNSTVYYVLHCGIITSDLPHSLLYPAQQLLIKIFCEFFARKQNVKQE